MQSLQEAIRYANSLQWTWQQVAVMFLLTALAVAFLVFIATALWAIFTERRQRSRIAALMQQSESERNLAQTAMNELGRSREQFESRLSGLEKRRDFVSEFQLELAAKVSSRLENLPAPLAVQLDRRVEEFVLQEATNLLAQNESLLRQHAREVMKAAFQNRLAGGFSEELLAKIDAIADGALLRETGAALARLRVEQLGEAELENLDAGMVQLAVTLFDANGSSDQHSSIRVGTAAVVAEYIEKFGSDALANAEDEIDPEIVALARALTGDKKTPADDEVYAAVKKVLLDYISNQGTGPLDNRSDEIDGEIVELAEAQFGDRDTPADSSVQRAVQSVAVDYIQQNGTDTFDDEDDIGAAICRAAVEIIGKKGEAAEEQISDALRDATVEFLNNKGTELIAEDDDVAEAVTGTVADLIRQAKDPGHVLHSDLVQAAAARIAS